jgi:hypothetical protein
MNVAMFQLFRDMIYKTWKKFKKIDATKNNSDNNEKDKKNFGDDFDNWITGFKEH